MASSSSSVVGKKSNAAQPQVFINFRGNLRTSFIDFLDHAMKRAKINVFTDKQQLKGEDLIDLILVEIKKSRVVLVILSKEYTSSNWCLEELVKIMECRNQGSLKVIPIFYRLEVSAVQKLEGRFGDSFRELKGEYQHEPVKIQKWEEALTSITQIHGMCLPEESDMPEREFIKSIVKEVEKVLEKIGENSNQTGTDSPQVLESMGSLQLVPQTQTPEPKAGSKVPARKVKSEANLQQASVVPSRQLERNSTRERGYMVPARKLDITHSENAGQWAWSTIQEPPSYATLEIATMKKIYWLKIVGEIETKDLIPGTMYEAVFVLELKNGAVGWEKPVTLKLKEVQHDGGYNRVDRTANLEEYIGQSWIDVQAGVFVVPPKNTPAEITFTMYQYVDTDKKTGLVLKGVIVRPVN